MAFILSGCMLLVSCVFLTMAHQPGHRDLKQLFCPGSEPTKKKGLSIGSRQALPAHVKIAQGKEVYEYSKLFFDSSQRSTS
jgi:hypothetical protein